MSEKILVVLFGHENDKDGRLLPPGVSRCAKAAELFRELSAAADVAILPTGGFGAHFNLSDEPHANYLTSELIKFGVPQTQILPGLTTSNTVQDCTEAWYFFKGGGFDRMVAVTSDYHEARVAFVLDRLSAGDDQSVIEVIGADTPADYKGNDKADEPRKFATLKREWVEVIRRNSNVNPERFVAVYDDAGREHRLYVTLSVAVVSALFVVNGFAFAIVPGNDSWALWLMLAALAILDLLLWSLYGRMADAARTARHVLTRMEIENQLPGFSFNRRADAREAYRSLPWRWSMKDLITGLTIVLFITLALVSLGTPIEPQTDAAKPGLIGARSPSPTPTPTASPTTASTPVRQFPARPMPYATPPQPIGPRRR